MRVSDYIIERIKKEGCAKVFLVTGRGALFLTDAVAKADDIEGVAMHHEQAAAFAAVAYADCTENLGACLVSTGCASTNAVTGVLSAWQDGISCVFISGQNILKETTRYTGAPIRTFGQQEADIVEIVKPITKYAVMLEDPNDIVFHLEKAICLARTGRKGPVWLDIPLDLQSAQIEPDELATFCPSAQPESASLPGKVRHLIQCLNEAKRPAILIGSGIRASRAQGALRRFIDETRIPVSYASSAPDVYGTCNEMSMGSIGIMGCSRSGSFSVQNSDVLLVLGNRLSPMTTGSDYSKFARHAKVFVVDIDKLEHSKETIRIDSLIEADVGDVLGMLINTDVKPAPRAWVEKCLRWKAELPKYPASIGAEAKVDLHYLSEIMSDVLPEYSVVVTDSGLIELILPNTLSFRQGMRVIHPASQGAMGFALPAAVGAYYASGQRVCAVIGDGSIMMNLQELETIRYNKLPITVIVISNNVYSIIRRRQKDLFRRRTIGTDPANGVSVPNFGKIADAFGFDHMRITSNRGLELGLKAALACDGPIIVEISGLEEQGYISIDHCRTVAGTYVLRPIEDQSPFLERNQFCKEMLIEPIDQ
jgi:acetolactate synthase I/II/III large subunit